MDSQTYSSSAPFPLYNAKVEELLAHQRALNMKAVLTPSFKVKSRVTAQVVTKARVILPQRRIPPPPPPKKKEVLPPIISAALTSGVSMGPEIMVPLRECWDFVPSFAPAPVVNPWAPTPAPPPPGFEIEVAEEARKRRERAALRRAAHQYRAVKETPFWECKVVLPARVIENEERRPPGWRPVKVRGPKPRTLRISGINCPPINGSWVFYARTIGESRRQHHRRVKSMVQATRLGKKIRYEDTFESWSFSDQVDWMSQRMLKNNPFVKLLDRVEKEPAPFQMSYPTQKECTGKKCIFPKFKNLKQQSWVDSCLEKKITLWHKNQDRMALISRQRFRMRAAVLFNNKTHVCSSLKSELIKNIVNYVKQQDPSMIPDLDDPIYNFNPDEVQLEMEDATKDNTGVDPAPIPDKKSNVILEDKEQASTSKSFPSASSKNEYACLAAPNRKVEIKDYVDRWITIKQGKWTSEVFDQNLFTIELPKEVLNDDKFRKSPNYMPFRNHVYWRGNMKIKMTVNANARQYGQLQLRFYYLSCCDANWSKRNNVFTGSQQPHALITASSSNSAELTIPFEYINPLLIISRGTKSWDDISIGQTSAFDEEAFGVLGALTCNVIVPLTTAETTPRVVSYSVLIAFEDSQFDGLIDASIVEGQMFSIASMFALQEIHNFLDPNRDNPTVSAVGAPVIPVNTGSWCAGNGLPEFTNVLRLNPCGSLPYQEGRVPAIDEMKIDYVKNIFGFFKQIKWNAQHGQGQFLYKMDAAPMLPLIEYHQITGTIGEASQYCLPPIAVLSSLFAWWRGAMDLRIDVIGAVELTGRLLVAYIPRYYRNVTMQQAMNCPHTIFDLQTTNRQFNFKIPFMSDKLFWRRHRIQGGKFFSYPPPATIQFFVYNELIANSTIPSDCVLNLYIRGASDFELSVPTFPNIATCFFPSIVLTTALAKKVLPKIGYSPVYWGTWHYYSNSGGYMPILRYGPTTEHVAQFNWEGDLLDVLYVPLVYNTNESNIAVKFTGDVNSSQEASHHFDNLTTYIPVVMLIQSEAGYFYVVGLPYIAPKLSSAANSLWIQLCKSIKEEVAKSNRVALVQVCNKLMETLLAIINVEQGRWFPGSAFKFDSITSFYVVSSDYLKPDNLILKLDAVTCEAGDQRTMQATPSSTPQASACGRQVGAMIAYGEKFNDLKDLCRRYQLYANGSFKTKPDETGSRVLLFKFPVLPQGLDLKDSYEKMVSGVKKTFPRHYWNRVRDGPIPLIASGYRFFCGSIRFRMAIDFVNLSDRIANAKAKVCVQHRPDFLISGLSVTSRSDIVVGSDDVELPGYATYFQFDDINNIISFEIPFYLPIVKSLLQRPTKLNHDANLWSSLGEVAVGITMVNNAANVNYEIYYSLGDDARFSCFMGFPPMIDLTNIPEVDAAIPDSFEVIHNEMDSCDWLFNIDDPYDQDPDLEYLPFFESEVEPEMAIWDYVPFAKTAQNVSSAADKIAEVDVDQLNKTIKESSSFISTLKQHVTTFVPTIESVKNKIEKYIVLIVNVITNFIHCIISLNIKSVITAIISILTTIKVVSYNFTASLIDNLFKLFQHENPGAPNELKEVAKEIVGEVTVEMAEEDTFVDASQIIKDENNYRAAYISSLIAGVAATLALVPRMLKSDLTSCCQLLFDGIYKFALSANCLFTFVKNNLVVIQRIGNQLVNYSPQLKDIQFLEKEQAEIYSWAAEVIELCDPWKEGELFSSVRKASRVHTLAASGYLIILKMSKLKLAPAQLNIISKLLDQIRTLRDRLSKAHMAPPVRFMPWVYEITGPTGTGKSEMLNDIPYKLLNAINLKVKGEVIYHRALGNPHWNNCRNQPVCSIDEKFPIAKQGFDDVQIAELFQLKSRCVFNPLMADLPDKNLRYNPLIVQYASNNAFPQLTGIIDPTAISRRRDMLIKVQFKVDIVANFQKPHLINKLPYALRRNWNCLEFYYAENPLEEQTKWVGPYSYDDMCAKMIEEWTAYYVREQQMFLAHMNRALSLQPDNEDNLATFEDVWRSKLELNDVEIIKVREFRNQYQEILKKFAEKELTEPQREAKLVILFRKFLGLEHQNQREENVIQEISEVRKKIKNFDVKDLEAKDIINPSAPKAEMGEKKNKSNRQLIDEAYDYLNLDDVCAHDFLLQSTNVKIEDTYFYDKEQDVWKLSDLKVDTILMILNDGREPPLYMDKFSNSGRIINCETYEKAVKIVKEDPTKIAQVEDGPYVIGNSYCKGDCIWKSEDCRQRFYKLVVSLCPLQQKRLISGAVDQLANEFPDEYATLMSKTLDERKGKQEAEKEKISFIKNLYITLKDTLMSVNWKKWFSRLAIVLGIFFFIGTLWNLWGYCTGIEDDLPTAAAMGSIGIGSCLTAKKLTDTAEANLFASGDYRQGFAPKKTPTSIARRHLAVVRDAKPEMAEQRFNAVHNKIKRNTFFISMSSPLGGLIIGRCLGICGRYALMVDHFMDAFNKFNNDYAKVITQFLPVGCKMPTAINIDFKDLKYTQFRDGSERSSGLGLIKLPKKLGLFQDIRKFIISFAQSSRISKEGMIIELNSDKNDLIISNRVSVNFVHHEPINIKGNAIYSDFRTGTLYRYPTFHGKGKCGSVLLAMDCEAPICGVHIAGDLHSGFSESIYREMFDELPAEALEDASAEMRDPHHQDWYVDGEVIGFGSVSAKFAHRASEKSRIIPSEVQNDPNSPFKVYSDVSVLSPKDPRIQDNPFSPMLEGVKFHGKPLKSFNKMHLKISIADYENRILANAQPLRQCVGVLSPLEAAGGIEGKDMYDSIEWNSSEGYPFTGLRPPGAHDKRWLFDFDESGAVKGFHKILQQRLDHKWQVRENGEVPLTVFVDCLKDCRVSKDKVLEPGKTRIFSIAPVDFTIQARQCTLDFTAAFMTNRLDLEHAIGINPDSREWTTLTTKLLKNNRTKILTGDYSKFGDTIPVEITHGFFNTIAKWYELHGILTPAHKRQLKSMGYEVGNSFHLMFNFIYRVVCGQPSGNPLTVNLNSYANSVYIRLAWLHIMQDTKYCALSDLHEHVTWFSYGDDLIASISDEVADRFNAVSLASFFQDHGLKFTNSNKGNEIIPYTGIEEAEFLKRGFAPHPFRKFPLNLVLAPLKEESIIDTVNWITKDYRDQRMMSVQVCEDALRNAFGRGPKFYEQFKSELTNFWQKKQVYFQCDSWMSLDRKVFDMDENLHPYFKFKCQPQ